MNGSNVSLLPRITSEKPVSEYTFKKNPDDFQVEEVPLYELEGDGPHLYFEVEKKNISTDRVQKIIADEFDRSFDSVGVAGRKDKKAHTIQRMSLEHVDPEDLNRIEHSKFTLKPLGYHRNKLQPGHLEGNRFRMTLNNVQGEDVKSRIESNMDNLRNRGLPNYFGPQRFGLRGDTAELGSYLVNDELDKFIHAYFGKAGHGEPEACERARSLFDEERYEESLKAWPDSERDKKKALSTYIDRGKPGPVLSAIPFNKRKLFVSAYQSQLFNELLARRIEEIDIIWKGDIAKKTDTGGMFVVEDPEEEQHRVDNFDISPTGLLPGSDPWQAQDRARSWEQSVMDEHQLKPGDFDKVSYLGAEGSRRFIRIKMQDSVTQIDVNIDQDRIDLGFFLPSGSYATVFLRELLGSLPE